MLDVESDTSRGLPAYSEGGVMETSQLVARLRRLGTDTANVEVKAAAGGFPKTLAETVSAFANGNGGAILLGLSETDGFRAAPGFDAQATRDALVGCLAHKVTPAIRVPVEIEAFEDSLVVRADVPALDNAEKPCYVTDRGEYSGAFIRGGDGDHKLTHYEVTQLIANQKQPEWDREVISEADMSHLDAALVPGLLSRVRMRQPRAFGELSDDESLVMLGAAAETDSGYRPTLAGYLTLGVYPQRVFPQLFISVVVHGQSDEHGTFGRDTDFLDNIACDGPIPVMIRDAVSAVRRNMRTASIIQGVGRKDRYDYPLEVIRELVTNAVMHRDYSPAARGQQVHVSLFPDRLEVTNPGGLFGSISAEQLGTQHVSSSRNQFIAKILEDTAFPGTGEMVCENRGSGIPRVVARLRDAEMSPPTFSNKPAGMKVTVPQHALLDPDTIEWIGSLPVQDLMGEQHLALALMRHTGLVTNELLRVWGVESRTATQALTDLVAKGLAVKSGGRRYATYELASFSAAPDPDVYPGDSELPEESGGVTNHDFGGISGPPELPTENSANATTRLPHLVAVVQAVRAGNDTSRAIGDALDVSYNTALRRIKEAKEAGLIEPTRPRHSRSQSYRLTPAGEQFSQR